MCPALAAPWIAAHQDPLSMGFSRQESWSGLPCVSPCSGTEPLSPALQADSLLLSNQRSHQFSSVTHSCPTLCDPTDCSTPGFPVHHQLPELAQTHIRGVSVAIQPSHHVFPFSSCLQSFLASGSFPMSQFFASGGQSIGVSASVSFLPTNIQD